MKSLEVDASESQGVFRRKSTGKYAEVADRLEKLSPMKAIEITPSTENGAVKLHSIFCGVRLELIRRGIYKQFTSAEIDNVLYITKL